jgi:hypothetical protein
VPSYSAGTAFLTVSPNLRGFETKVRSYLKTNLRAVMLDVTPNVDDAKAKAELKEVSRDRSTNLRVDVDDRSARSRLAALLRPRRMTVNVDADTSAATARIAALRGGGGGGGILGAGLAGGALLGGPLGAPLLGGAAAGATAIAGAGGAGAIFGASLIGQIAAMKKAQKELQTTGKHLQTLTKGTKEYNAQAKLFAAQQKDYTRQFGPAAKALVGLAVAWKGFLGGTKTQTMKVIVDALGIVSKLLPKLIPVANAAGKAIDGVLKLFGQFVNGPEGKQVLHFFQTFGSVFITQFGKIGINLLKGLFGLFIAFAPLTKIIGDNLVRSSGAFAAWTKNLGKTKGFQSFIAYVKDNGPKLLSILGSLAKIFGRIVVAFAPLGGQILTVVAAFFKLLSKAPTPVVLALALALVACISPVAGVVLAIGVLVVAFEHLWPAIKRILGSFTALIGDLKRISSPLTALIGLLKGPLVAALHAGGNAVDQLNHTFHVKVGDSSNFVNRSLKDMVGFFGGFSSKSKAHVDKATTHIKTKFVEIKNGWFTTAAEMAARKVLLQARRDKLRTDLGKARDQITSFQLWANDKLMIQVTIANLGRALNAAHAIAAAYGGGGVYRPVTARAAGGPVSKGMAYLVGERGPELFSPSTSGRIIPNGGGRGGFSAGGRGRGPGGPRDDAILVKATIVPQFGTSGAKDGARFADRIMARVSSLLGVGVVAAMDRLIHRLSAAVTGGLRGRGIPIGHGYYRPISGPVTNGLHDQWTGFPALDFGGPVGRPVASVAPGRVAASYDIRGYEPRRYGAQDGYRSYGRVIQIRHNGFSTLYAHLSRRGVRAGQSVAGGTIIGLSGNTGNSTGPHLHFGSAGITPYAFVGGATGGHTVFDGGGVARGAGYIPKRTIEPERVLTAHQTRSFDRLVGALDRGRGGVNVEQNFAAGSIVARSQKELAKEFARQQQKKLVRLTR